MTLRIPPSCACRQQQIEMKKSLTEQRKENTGGELKETQGDETGRESMNFSVSNFVRINPTTVHDSDALSKPVPFVQCFLAVMRIKTGFLHKQGKPFTLSHIPPLMLVISFWKII